MNLIKTFFLISGRATRLEARKALSHTLLVFIILLMLGDISYALVKEQPIVGYIVIFFADLIFFTLFLRSVIVNIKRFHDRDKSGWWILVTFIPIIGFMWILIELCLMKGTAGANRFGEEPIL